MSGVGKLTRKMFEMGGTDTMGHGRMSGRETESDDTKWRQDVRGGN